MSLPKFLRRHMKKFLWVIVVIIAITFGASGVISSFFQGMFRKEFASLFGEPVSEGKFHNISIALNQWSMMTTGSRKAVPEEAVWEHIMMLREAQNSGIVCTEKELAEWVENWYKERKYQEQIVKTAAGDRTKLQKEWFKYATAPEAQQKEMLSKIPWDEEEYATMLERYRFTIEQFEWIAIQKQTIGKLILYLLNSVNVPFREAHNTFISENIQKKVDLVYLTNEQFIDKVKIEEEPLAQYYAKHKDNWEVPVRVALEYVFIPFEDIKLDKLTEEEIKNFYNRKKKIVYRKMHHQRHREDSDQHSEESKFKPLESVRGDVIERLTKERKLKEIKAMLEELKREINNIDKVTLKQVKEITTEFELDAGETNPFSDTEYLRIDNGKFGLCSAIRPMTAMSEDVVNRQKSGKFEGPVECDTGALLHRISKYIGRHHPPLDAVRDEVVKSYKTDKSIDLATEQTEKLREEALTQKGFTDQFILKYGLVKMSTEFFESDTNGGKIKGITDDLKLIKQSFELDELGDISEPVQIQAGGKQFLYLIQYIDKKEPDMELFEAKSESIKNRLIRKAEMEFIENWKQDLERRANLQKYYEKKEKKKENDKEKKPAQKKETKNKE